MSYIRYQYSTKMMWNPRSFGCAPSVLLVAVVTWTDNWQSLCHLYMVVVYVGETAVWSRMALW